MFCGDHCELFGQQSKCVGGKTLSTIVHQLCESMNHNYERKIKYPLHEANTFSIGLIEYAFKKPQNLGLHTKPHQLLETKDKPDSKCSHASSHYHSYKLILLLTYYHYSVVFVCATFLRLGVSSIEKNTWLVFLFHI